jgi:Mrp family chromosome partitioning ATPase
MEALLPELQSYDMIIVDLPPLASGIDRLAVSPLLDGVILVAEWGQTPVDVLGELVRSLHVNQTLIIGVVMTKVRVMSMKHYKRHGSRLPV